MRRSIARLAGVLALAAATAAFAGAAVAGNGNGNGNDSAPGQVKKEQAAQPAPAPAAPAPAAPAAQPAAQPQKTSPGQAKKAARQSAPAASSTSSSSHGVNATTAGKKPSSTTQHWTHCLTGGGTGAAATCTGIKGTKNDQPDVSKRYGNGKTAAQIANGRGAPANTELTGPGNSQPHKVTACGKPNNKSGGVDVHAVKSYDAAKCQPSVTQSVTEQHVCGSVMKTTNTQQVVPVFNGKSGHLSKKKTAVVSSSVTQVTPTGETCGTASEQQTQQQTHESQQTQESQQEASHVSVQALPATQGLPASAAQSVVSSAAQAPASAAAPQQSQGGVAGAQATLTSPKHSRGGVLGTVGNVAGTSLPFTGFPVWAAVLVALALIAGGLMLRRRAFGPRL